MDHPNIFEIDALDHELLTPYLGLRERNWTRQSGIFIAEGPLLVERLIASTCEMVSVLLDRKYFQHYINRIPNHVPVVLVDHSRVAQIVGFNFHRGVLACGKRPAVNSLSDALPPADHRDTWIGLVGVQDPENVGGILRSAAGLGIQRVLIGPGTADPLSRRALRVSMGNVLALELYESRCPHRDLALLAKLGIQSIATCLDSASESLETAGRNGPLIIWVGNEKHGLPQEFLQSVERRVCIDMCQGTDSLNVSVAAAIAMYHFLRLAGTS